MNGAGRLQHVSVSRLYTRLYVCHKLDCLLAKEDKEIISHTSIFSDIGYLLVLFEIAPILPISTLGLQLFWL